MESKLYVSHVICLFNQKGNFNLYIFFKYNYLDLQHCINKIKIHIIAYFFCLKYVIIIINYSFYLIFFFYLAFNTD